jgi:hypothetical protein
MDTSLFFCYTRTVHSFSFSFDIEQQIFYPRYVQDSLNKAYNVLYIFDHQYYSLFARIFQISNV